MPLLSENTASTSNSYRSNRKPPNKSRMKCLKQPSVDDDESLDQLDEKASTSVKDSFGFEEERKLIRSHPLYPALKLLALKCERATTQTSFNDYGTTDLMKALHTLKSNDCSIKTDNSDVDSLMISAILELRLHLKQLEKLNADAEKCQKRLNGYVKKAQDRLTRIMQSDYQDIEPPLFEVPVKKRCTSFTIAALLNDAPHF